MKKTTKLLLVILPLLFILAVGVLDLSLNRFGLADCGCGDPSNNTGAFDSQETAAVFQESQMLTSLVDLTGNGQKAVLGEQYSDNKWIEVDLSEQKLVAWDNGTKYLETLVSTGKWNRTPVGTYAIWSKFKYTKMSGGSKALHTYYYLPNVPFTMYFFKGYGLHGTYWHNNFGTPMSHGCVNLPTSAAEKLFYWAAPVVPEGKNSTLANKDNPGTKVVIHE